jgi:acetyl esterase/lipase
MRYEKINLNEHFPYLKTGESGDGAVLTAYVPDNSDEIDIDYKRPTIIILPGSGYYKPSAREAETVAFEFLAENYNAFVLWYSTETARYPQQLLEASAAIAFVRRHADEYNIETDSIVLWGASAGGHAAATVAAFWDERFIADSLHIEFGENKPTALILAYPVITSGKYAHRGSFYYLLGDDPSPELLSKMSIEKQVTDNMPPAFIWHTATDASVPVQNSLLLAEAYAKNGIPFELHIFPEGPHGLSLCRESTAGLNHEMINPHAEQWVSLCNTWLKRLFAK